jgi:hypothetical protein
MRIRAAIFTVLVPFVAAGCHDDKPKTSEPAGSATVEAIPSDLVYNSFVDDTKPGQTAPTAPGGGDGGAAAATAATSQSKLVEPGADPKAPLRYAFSTKTRTVDTTITSSGGGAAGMDQPPIHFVFTATPKPKSMMGHDATIDVKVTKFDLQLPANAPPDLAAGKEQLEKALVGLTGHFDVSEFGEVGDTSFDASKLPRGAANVASVLEQAFALIVVPLPAEPVGVGAKWTKSDSQRMADQGATVTAKMTVTLVSRDAHGATFKVENTSSGTIAVHDPRAPKGTTVERKSTSSYTVVARLDGVASKVDGQAQTTGTQKVPGQQDQSMQVQQKVAITSK